MNVSFELLSSMSPKVNKQRQPIRKPPTILALKKYFRKSAALDNTNTSANNESIITIESSSNSLSSDEKILNQTPIIISDSETSFEAVKSPIKRNLEPVLFRNNFLTPEKTDTRDLLPQEKYTNIKLWIDEVNNINQNVSLFSEASTVCGGENCSFRKPKTNVALSSTLLKSSSPKRFDQLFKKKESVKSDLVVPTQDDQSDRSEKSCNSKKSNFAETNDRLQNDNEVLENNFKNMTIDDSFELNLDDSLKTSLLKKSSECQADLEVANSCGRESNCDSVEYESLLDSLYGNSWRAKKPDILPSSEPKLKISNKTNNKIPNTERCVNTVSSKNLNVQTEKSNSNLLKTLQKTRFKRALESPWVQSLKNICDPDDESDTEEKVLLPTKLNFEDDKNSNEENQSESSNTNCSNKNVQSNTGVSKVVKKTKPKQNKAVLKEQQNNVPKSYSFLASLSANVPVPKCDMSAMIYRNNFKQHKDALAGKLFKLYNEKVFDNSVPKDTPLEWNDRMRGTAGYCYCRKITRRTGAIERAARIVLSTKVLDSADRLRDTLIHEMCHAATWIVNQVSDGHGSFWRAWADRAMEVFPELPPIRRCHQYVINTKYTYKCTSCGYSIGRHTKSLDTERKRCGYCYGSFEILINKTSKKGETKSVPVTPKPTKGFALFVKENYATYKTPDRNHGDVMKILGQKFSSLKIDKP